MKYNYSIFYVTVEGQVYKPHHEIFELDRPILNGYEAQGLITSTKAWDYPTVIITGIFLYTQTAQK